MNQSQQNLLKAIEGESIARNKYTFFAKQATKESSIWIAKVFEETADNERAHAEEEYEKIKGKVETTNEFNIHQIGTTLENLRAAEEGEKFEWGTMYPDFEKTARDEGETEIADLFKEISEVEEKHMQRYGILADLIEKNVLYQSENEIEWKCLNCGYIHRGTSAPEKCPLCKKPQGWYMGLGIVR